MSSTGEAVAALRRSLARTSRAAQPYERGALAYRLGLATAESSGGEAAGLRAALASYDEAAALFDPRFTPVEHARVLNAAGAAHRGLGDVERSVTLFERSADLLAGRGRDGERAAALNNLGLSRTELGRLEGALEAFDEALALFDTRTEEGRRGRAATLHNRGQAHAAVGTEIALAAALADYDAAVEVLGSDDAPYHRASISHSVALACRALAVLSPARRRELTEQAVSALERSLTVFTLRDFPFQHALALHNVGLVHADYGGVDNLRRALICFEDALTTLDPRLHTAPWRQIHDRLAAVHAELDRLAGPQSRSEHFAALAGGADAAGRRELLGDRLPRLLLLPDARRHGALVELAAAVAVLPAEQARATIAAELAVLMEMPNDALDEVLRAIVAAHGRIEPEPRARADEALDGAIGDALGGPQRVHVRDFLSSLGWERP